MKEEEARHAEEARDRGGIDLPRPVRDLMRMAAKVMTRTAHHL
jgi:ubiquinone biosynthesis monooxygenase Coq7